MSGYTIVLIDSEQPEDGDFVHVESFGSFDELQDTPEGEVYPEWVDRLMRAAVSIEQREVPS